MESNSKIIDIFIVIQDGNQQYYLMKIEKRNYDVYCFLPHLGVHHSLHESGESHFQLERKPDEPTAQPPVILSMGEAGIRIEEHFMVGSIKELGRASGICNAIFVIDALATDYDEFNRSVSECFIINRGSFSRDTKAIEVGIWAVPDRNKASFEFNNPNIAASMLYKIVQCEPQIWIYAKSC